MARKTFFSFHYQRDAWRAGQVRNSNLLADEDEYGFVDSVEWEKIEREGDAAIERWINKQMEYTSVTVVLIGAETAGRRWVDHEIRTSWDRGNGIVGIRIHNVKDKDGKTDALGLNPLDKTFTKDGKPLSFFCKTYDWVTDNGRENLGKWIEEAFQARAAYTGEKSLKSEALKQAMTPSPRRSIATINPTVIQNPPRPWAQ